MISGLIVSLVVNQFKRLWGLGPGLLFLRIHDPHSHHGGVVHAVLSLNRKRNAGNTAAMDRGFVGRDLLCTIFRWVYRHHDGDRALTETGPSST
jgi:hypothetical protein